MAAASRNVSILFGFGSKPRLRHAIKLRLLDPQKLPTCCDAAHPEWDLTIVYEFKA
jgi:hypothetical protein